MSHAEDMDTVWLNLIAEVLMQGKDVSPRGQLTKELLSSTVVVDMTRPVVTVAVRKMGYRFLAAEAAWILSGSDNAATIARYSERMLDFSDDGETLFGAYGPKIVDQIDYVVGCLKKDRDSRQAVINIWRENPPPTKDCPCTLSCQFLLRDDRLDAFVTMRSSDVWLGVVYDVPTFSMVAAAVLLKLGAAHQRVKLGNLYQTAASRHLYERDFIKARECLDLVVPRREYQPFNIAEFNDVGHLVAHLWAVAQRGPTRHRWLTEFIS